MNQWLRVPWRMGLLLVGLLEAVTSGIKMYKGNEQLALLYLLLAGMFIIIYNQDCQRK